MAANLMAANLAADPSGAVASSHWYRVAKLTPALRPHLRFHRHFSGDHVWYVIEDAITNRFHKFEMPTYELLRHFDGKTTLDVLWSNLVGRTGLTQESIVTVLGQLYQSDLLQSQTVPDVADLLRRSNERIHKDRLSRYANPLAIRIKLFDPQQTLENLTKFFAPIWNFRGVLLWLLVVLPALFLVPVHWKELSGNFTDRLLAFNNLIAMLVLFPIIKIVHEFAHGLACQMRKGQVHEMGVLLLMFLPVPYVDASSSSGFNRRRDRILVSAAGMLAEFWIAAIAFYFWIVLEPGIARALAYDAMIVASVTTVVFNANPLMRYDGYFMLSDALGVPNLAQQSTLYWRYLFERYGLNDARSEAPSSALRSSTNRIKTHYWLMFYGPASTAYRVFILCVIAWFISTQYFFLGVMLAVWSVATGIVWPCIKFVRYLIGRKVSASPGARGVWVVPALLSVLLGLFMFIPMPYYTTVQGVVLAAEDALIRATIDGFIVVDGKRSGVRVSKGDNVMLLGSPLLKAQVEVQQARVELSTVKVRASWLKEPAKGAQLQQELQAEQAAMRFTQERFDRGFIQAKHTGQLWLYQERDLPGRYFRQGDVIGYVAADDKTVGRPFVKVLLDQDAGARLQLEQERTLGSNGKVNIELKPTWNFSVAVQGSLLRAVPKVSQTLPDAALGKAFGGDIPVDPSDEKGTKALQPFFEFDIAANNLILDERIGARVQVRIAHAWEPLSQRTYRYIRRQFMSQFQA
jgi:putative peptide zinc metalloprotease protein